MICAVMVSAFESVLEIGLDLTPEAWVAKVGKTAAEDAMKAAVKGAKVCANSHRGEVYPMDPWPLPGIHLLRLRSSHPNIQVVVQGKRGQGRGRLHQLDW